MTRLEELSSLLRVLPSPADGAPSYGALRAELGAGGQVIGNNDLRIAAHVKAAKLILVTNTEREFQRVSGLEVQNWVKSERPTSTSQQRSCSRPRPRIRWRLTGCLIPTTGAPRSRICSAPLTLSAAN